MSKALFFVAAALLFLPWSAMAESGYVGIQIQPMTEDVATRHQWKGQGLEGVYVRDVYLNSPGERSGIKAGDIITKFDGATVQGFNQMLAMSRTKSAGDVAKLVVVREGREQAIALTYEKQPTGEAKDAGTVRLDAYGMTLAPLSAAIKKRLAIVLDIGGVAIVAAEPGRPAAQAGLAVGDVIVGVGDGPLSDPGRFKDAMAAAAEKGGAVTVILQVLNDGKTRAIGLTQVP